jgi:hypothetical protein
MTRYPHIHGRRGFAMILAITLIILVGAALAVMGRAVVAEAARTRNEAADAQLRQLLTAAAVTATEDRDLDQNYFVDLPPQLQQAQASVSIAAKHSQDVATVTIDAKLGSRSASQTLTFKREGDRWVLTEARQM